MGSTASAPGITSHGNCLFLLHHVLEEGDGAGEFPAVDGLGGLAGVFEGGAQVGAPGAGGFARVEVRGCVADLRGRRDGVSGLL